MIKGAVFITPYSGKFQVIEVRNNQSLVCRILNTVDKVYGFKKDHTFQTSIDDIKRYDDRLDLKLTLENLQKELDFSKKV